MVFRTYMARHRWLIPVYTSLAFLVIGLLAMSVAIGNSFAINTEAGWLLVLEVTLVCLAASAALAVPSILVLRRDDRTLSQLRDLNSSATIFLATPDKEFEDAIAKLDIDFYQSPDKPFGSSMGVVIDSRSISFWTAAPGPQCAYRIPWKSVGPISTGYTRLRNLVGPQATVRPALKVPVTSDGHTIALSFAVTSTLDGPAGGSVDISQLRRMIAPIDHERSRSAAL